MSLNLFLDGLLNAASPDSGFAAATIEGYATVGGGFFSFRRILRGDGAEEGFNDFFTDGVLGDPAGARLTTPTVRVNFDTPIALSLHLQAGVFSRGVFSSALSDFGGSFKFASGDVFNLPDGVTVNAGDYLVNNRFIDPLAPPSGAVPEPAAWALMITGFGLAGATLRRRHLLV